MNAPTVTAGAALVTGTAFAVAAVYILAGVGWALLAAAVPFLLLSAVIFRGLLSG